ncbi:alkylglycerol monooxygenase-like [Mytilus californianus]|uniref:alkylglycerol monooxygenase-like n=1 Tax=Mytilus californianus TaxID=6549 RepID=UPI00224574BC|nr:alkylglycerol monooxygenase-like [Mytilus californianus]
MASVLKVPFDVGMRRLFYAVTPNETSFSDVKDVPAYTDESGPFFFVLIFLELAISAYKKDGKYRLGDSITSISAGVISRFPLLFVKAISLVAYMWVHEHFKIFQLPWNSQWTWWLCFLGVDLGYYWFHRLAHKVNFMWAAHQVHHSSEDYNLATALRQSVLQSYTSWVFYLPLALFIPPQIFIVHQELNILYQFWIHTQYIKSLGPLEYILNTPSHHRVHHGRNRYCIDKNYAGTLIIWDRLFGTFEAENEEVVYGLTHPLNTFDPNYVQFCHAKYTFRRFLDTKGIKNKLGVLFCGPGWDQGKPRTGLIEDIPNVKAPHPKYDPKHSLIVNIYAAVHFTVLLIMNLELVTQKGGLSQALIICLLLYFGFSLTCFGKIFDNAPGAVYCEITRCGASLLLDWVMCFFEVYQPSDRPESVMLLQMLFFISIVSIMLLFTIRKDKTA